MIINGHRYKIPELDFNAVCVLEDMGVSLTEMDKKVLSTIRAFLALAMDGDYEKAGKEIEAHLSDGGTLDDFMKEINKAVETSGFFRALSQSKAKRDPAGESEEEQKRKAAAAQES